jgi:DNA-damage-inducible protein J
MAKSETMHIRVDPEVKAGAEATLSQLGLSIADAVNIFFRQVMLTGGLPFEVKLPVPNTETVAALKEAIRISRDPNLKGYTSVDELFRELDADV